MNLIRASIDRPIAVIAAVLIAVLFGSLALSRIPVQLAPDVRKPIVVVETAWPGAAPSEVERSSTCKKKPCAALTGLRL
jgi:HAE1 family hydrophobic/amphiphilic exporter-1